MKEDSAKNFPWSNSSYTVHGTGTETGMGMIENNVSLFLCSVYSRLHGVI